MSQVDKLYRYLEQNGSITGMECINKLKILNYKGRIFDLRSLGVDIKSEPESKKNEDGEVIRYTRYVLVKP